MLLFAQFGNSAAFFDTNEFSSCLIYIAFIDSMNDQGVGCSLHKQICCDTCSGLADHQTEVQNKYIALLRLFTYRKMIDEVFAVTPRDYNAFLETQAYSFFY